MLKLSAAFSLLFALGIVAGAFGAHALKGTLSPKDFEIYQTATEYHVINSLGGLIVSLFCLQGYISGKTGKVIPLIILASTLIFSGSLYLLVLMNWRWMGAITPIGGSGLILAWIGTSLSLFRYANSIKSPQ